MRIGLVADSHGNVDYLVLVAERLVSQHKVDRIFHLGGGSRDVEDVISFKKKMLRGTEEYGDDAFLADVADFLASSGGGPGSKGDEIAQFRKMWTVVRDEGEGGQPEKVVDMLGSHLVLAVHDPAVLAAEDVLNSTIILHGKAERFGALEKKRHWFLCPGHLRDKEYEGRPATFAVLEIVPKSAKMSVFSVAGELLQEFPLVLERKGKMTAR
ncbi:MAG TPA: metallophosphoesterase family protein [bacterium]|nr:metallophosphoesterase family protein [bacterium]